MIERLSPNSMYMDPIGIAKAHFNLFGVSNKFYGNKLWKSGKFNQIYYVCCYIALAAYWFGCLLLLGSVALFIKLWKWLHAFKMRWVFSILDYEILFNLRACAQIPN